MYPSRYGYRSVENLIALDFGAQLPQVLSEEHLRVGVAAKERHSRLPKWMARLPYRWGIVPTVFVAVRTLRRYRVAMNAEVPG